MYAIRYSNIVHYTDTQQHSLIYHYAFYPPFDVSNSEILGMCTSCTILKI